MRWRGIVTIIVVAGLSSSVWGAGGIFKRPPKPDPVEHVPALIKTLQSDPDERKRASAAEDLRDHDIKSFPEIVPALIEALQNDASISVRIESVKALAKPRTPPPTAVYAIAQAAQKDPAFRVRLAAKTTSVELNLRGIRVPAPMENNSNQTVEPPLADPPGSPIGPPVLPPPSGSGSSATDKSKPPRREPPLMPSQGTGSSRPKPLFPLLPTKSSKPEKPGDDGPALVPPM